MLNKILSRTYYLVFLFLFSSCQKEVHIDLGSSPAVPVVEGVIQTNMPPYVVLTSTISFFSEISLGTLQNSFLHGAQITVSDGTKTVQLKEYAIDTGANNKVYVYSIDTNNLAGFLRGIAGNSYTLKIVYNGTTYSSVTKIPNPKGVDTMWFDKPQFTNKRTPDSALQLYVNYTDPDTPGNYVRAFTQKNKEPFYPTGLFSDQAVNGLKITKIALFAGFEDTTGVKRDTVRYFFPGDTVTLNWCQIDKGVYTFWNSEIYASQTLGDPFASPINTVSNISNGAVGYWAGYSSATKTVVIQR